MTGLSKYTSILATISFLLPSVLFAPVFFPAEVIAETNTELFTAIKDGQTAQVETLLLKEVVDINAREEGYYPTLLITAARRGLTDLVDTLIKKGAEVDARTIENETALILAAGCGITDSDYGRTCLNYPEKKSFIDTVNLLLKKGAEINAKSSTGLTALIAASRGGFTDIVRALSNRGAEINSQTQNGNTALIEAARRGHTETVNVLLEHGADPKVKNNNGDTALGLAEKKGYSEIVTMIRKTGAIFE